METIFQPSQQIQHLPLASADGSAMAHTTAATREHKGLTEHFAASLNKLDESSVTAGLARHQITGPYKQRFERTMAHAKGAKSVEAAIAKLTPEYRDELLQAMQSSRWEQDCFKSDQAYHALIHLYCSGQISEERLIHATQIVETYDSFGLLKPSSILPAHCKNLHFVDLNDESTCPPELQKKICEGMDINTKSALAEMKAREKRVDCAVVNVTPEVIRNIKQALQAINGQGQYDAILATFTSYAAMASLSERAPCQIIVDEDNNRLYIPGFEFWAELNRQLPHPVHPRAIYGTTSAEDMAQLRYKDQHPIILYNPLVKNNFLFPHNSYHSALFSSLHDVHHWIRLGWIPPRHRDCFYAIDRAMVELNEVINRIQKDGDCLKNILPEDFIAHHTRIFGQTPGLPAVFAWKHTPSALFHTPQKFELKALNTEDKVRRFLDLDIHYGMSSQHLKLNLEDFFGNAFLEMEHPQHQRPRVRAVFVHYIFYKVLREQPDFAALLRQIPVALPDFKALEGPDLSFPVCTKEQLNDVLSYLSPTQ